MEQQSTPTLKRWQAAAIGLAVICACVVGVLVPDPLTARAAAITAFCLILWLSEAVPVYVPTLALFTLVPALLASFSDDFALRNVMAWGAEPVLILFFGGFALGAAAAQHGIDHIIAGTALRMAGGRVWVLVIMLTMATAFLSMWMSNIAAAALMIVAVKPMLRHENAHLRAALLLAVAFGANLGGMATPIGTGPNAIALASMPQDKAISFLLWMAFALPLTFLMLAAACGLILLRHNVAHLHLAHTPHASPDTPGQRPRIVAALAAATIAAWLSEPLHGVPAPLVALGLAVVLFGSGLLPAEALRKIDWSTLMVIAGGIGLGRLIEHTGLFHTLSARLAEIDTHPMALSALLIGASALMSALMSNTATATLLIPIAAAVEPGRVELPILIAIAASFGMPFVISTPINAMVVGAGLRQRDLVLPGVVLMVGGCALIALTGRQVLGLLGY